MKRVQWLFCIAVLLLASMTAFIGCERENVSSENTAAITAPSLGTYEEAIAELQTAETDEEAFAILERCPEEVREEILTQCEGALGYASVEPEPWTGPAVDAVMASFGKSRNEIIAVQRMVMLENGTPIDSVAAVITDKDDWYYYRLADGTLSTELPESKARTTEMNIYGTNVELLEWHAYCWSLEWGITFYLPVCFHEVSPGRFDGILDAWAPNPSCSWNCNGGLCALYQCGSAWNGAGYNGWWNYHSCSQGWSKKVAKIVQKRWLHTWQLCHGRSNRQIAQSVRARIRY